MLPVEGAGISSDSCVADADLTNMPLFKAVAEALGGQLVLDDLEALEMMSLESGFKVSAGPSTE